MTRIEFRFLSVCKELKLYRNMGNREALAVATSEWRKLHDDLGTGRAIELIRKINNANT